MTRWTKLSPKHWPSFAQTIDDEVTGIWQHSYNNFYLLRIKVDGKSAKFVLCNSFHGLYIQDWVVSIRKKTPPLAEANKIIKALKDGSYKK